LIKPNLKMQCTCWTLITDNRLLNYN